MLKMWRKPVRIQRSNEFVAILRGNDGDIDGVAQQRRHVASRQRSQFSREYFVKVRYTVADDGLINIQAVWVSADQRSWSCFYKPAYGQEGERSVCRGKFTYFYLFGGEDLVGVYEALQRYEDDCAIARLAGEGPAAFEFVDELAEDVFNDVLPTTTCLSRLLGR